jgi:hypothetical protein
MNDWVSVLLNLHWTGQMAALSRLFGAPFV